MREFGQMPEVKWKGAAIPKGAKHKQRAADPQAREEKGKVQSERQETREGMAQSGKEERGNCQGDFKEQKGKDEKWRCSNVAD